MEYDAAAAAILNPDDRKSRPEQGIAAFGFQASSGVTSGTHTSDDDTLRTDAPVDSTTEACAVNTVPAATGPSGGAEELGSQTDLPTDAYSEGR